MIRNLVIFQRRIIAGDQIWVLFIKDELSLGRLNKLIKLNGLNFNPGDHDWLLSTIHSQDLSSDSEEENSIHLTAQLMLFHGFESSTDIR